MSDNEIIYYPIIGKVRTYSWNDVKEIYYKSGLRGHSRLVIETDKKLYMDCEMMKNCGEIVKLIMKKGYLKTFFLTMNELICGKYSKTSRFTVDITSTEIKKHLRYGQF